MEEVRAQFLEGDPLAEAHLRHIHGVFFTNLLEREWEQYVASDPFSVSVKHNPPMYDCVVTIDVVNQLLRCLLGDIVHSLKSSLDYAVNSLIHDASGRKYTFPISSDRHQLELTFNRSSKDPKNATLGEKLPWIKEYILYELRPFIGEANLLFALNKLDNADKHRLLTPAFTFTTVGRIGGKSAFGTEYSNNTMVLTNGARFGTIFSDTSPIILDEARSFNAEWVFGPTDAQELNGKHIIPTLRTMATSVEAVLKRLKELSSG